MGIILTCELLCRTNCKYININECSKLTLTKFAGKLGEIRGLYKPLKSVT